MPPQTGTLYTLPALLEDCAESPKHSKADSQVFRQVWGGLMAWTASSWMVGKGVHLAPMGKFVFFSEELDLGTRKKLSSKVPSFIANEEYLRSYGIKYKSRAQRKEEGVAMEMNYANIAQFAATGKDMVQLALKDIFLHLGRTIGAGRKVSIDFYIGRLSAEHGIVQFNFFDTESLQHREHERQQGANILNTSPPDGNSVNKQGGMAGNRETARSRRTMSSRSNYSFGSEPPKEDVQLSLGISAPPSVNERHQTSVNPVKQSNRSVYDAENFSVASSRVPTAMSGGGMSGGGQTGRSGLQSSRSRYSQYSALSGMDEEDDEYTNNLGLIGSKDKPDPGQPYLLGAGSPVKAHVISNAYGRYEDDIRRRQDAADKLDKESQDRQRLQQQVEILKSEQKRREQGEMKRMLAKQVVERQKKREDERRDKLVPYDLTHVLPLERDRDFFQEYAEKQGMKRALFKQMEEKKNIKQRELDRERAMDLESKEALATSLAKEHALNSYTRQNAGNMLKDNWAKQIRLRNAQRRIDGDAFAPEPVGKRG